MTCSLRLKLVLARIQHGATVSASQETIQVGMAEAMIQRLAQEDPEAEAARPDCQGDLTGRMTPPAQPTAFDANTPPDPKELANKLEKVPGRARRSSMVRRGALDEAARSAAKNHRKSIAGIQKSKLIDDDANKDRPMAARCDSILQAVANTRKRNRLSICKAVETLEAAGLGDEPDKEAVAQQLEMVQKCLLEARKKHRDTVAKVAMETVSPTSATTDEKPKFQMSASAKAFNPNQQSIEEKIRSAVKAAHQRAKQERGEVAAPPRGHDQWGNPYAAWGSGYDQTGYGYAQAYHPGYNQANAFNQCYDPSWNNQMGYAQGQHWQQPQQAWTQAGAGQNCWGVRLFRSNCCLWWGLLQLLWRKLLWLWPASGSDSASSIFRPGPLAQRSMGRGLDARHFDCTRCDTDMLQNAHVTRKLWLGGRAYAKVPVEYWRCDVLAHDFVQSLARRVEGIGRPAAILAMHLCGRLFDKISKAAACQARSWTSEESAGNQCIPPDRFDSVLRAGAMLLAAFQRGSKGTARCVWKRHVRRGSVRRLGCTLGEAAEKDPRSKRDKIIFEQNLFRGDSRDRAMLLRFCLLASAGLQATGHSDEPLPDEWYEIYRTSRLSI
eukprot:s1070_g16.t1